MKNELRTTGATEYIDRSINNSEVIGPEKYSRFEETIDEEYPLFKSHEYRTDDKEVLLRGDHFDLTLRYSSLNREGADQLLDMVSKKFNISQEDPRYIEIIRYMSDNREVFKVLEAFEILDKDKVSIFNLASLFEPPPVIMFPIEKKTFSNAIYFSQTILSSDMAFMYLNSPPHLMTQVFKLGHELGHVYYAQVYFGIDEQKDVDEVAADRINYEHRSTGWAINELKFLFNSQPGLKKKILEMFSYTSASHAHNFKMLQLFKRLSTA